MRSRSISVLTLCLLLAACAPDDRGASSPTPAPSPAPAAAPVAPAADAAAPAPADEHAHHHDSSVEVALQRPPGGGNWPTDAPLRQGMEAIHGALTSALPAFEKGELGAEAASALAREVQAQVQYLIANCKLEPAADAQLHIVIGQMLAAAEALAKDPSSADGMPRLHQAMQLYGEHFEHPGLHDLSGAAHHADGEPEHADQVTEPAGN